MRRRGWNWLAANAMALVVMCLIGGTASAQAPAISSIVVARGVTAGRPVDPGTVFPPDAKIFVTFQTAGLASGTGVQSVWYLMSDAGPAAVGDASVTITAQKSAADVSLAPPGTGWREGDYRVVLLIDSEQAGVAKFTITRQSGATAPPATAPTTTAPTATAPTTTAAPATAAKPPATFVFTPAPPKPTPASAPAATAVAPPASASVVRTPSGFSATPPDGWSVSRDVAGIDVRMTPARGDGVIEVSAATGPGADPASIAATWETAMVGRGKLFNVRLRGDPMTVAGARAYVAVYAGATTYCKAVFIAAGDRGIIVTGVFAIANFTAGERLFDQMLRTAMLSR